MENYHKKLLIFSLIIYLLVSCTAPTATPPSIQSSPTPSHTADVNSTASRTISTVNPLLPANTVSTGTATIFPNQTPTPNDVFANPNEITDGILKLSIKELERKCYSPGSAISLEFLYQNLTDGPLTMVDYEQISSVVLRGGFGQLFPILGTTSHKPIFNKLFYFGIIATHPTSPIFQEIYPQSSFSLRKNYYLPTEVGEEDERRQVYIRLLSPGQYLLRFAYTAIEHEGSWEGTVTSNQITICVEN